MAYSLKDVSVEIEKIIEGFESRNERRLHPEWITNAFMNSHPDVNGDDASVHLLLSRDNVRSMVRKRLNAYKAKPEVEPDAQMVMDGFERLQRRYLVNEDDEQVAVKVELLSQSQIHQKECELRAMGAGCYQHADELARFARLISAAA